MCDGDGDRVAFEGGLEDEAGVDERLGESARRNALGTNDFAAVVEVDGPEFLVGEIDEFGADVVEEILTVANEVVFAVLLLVEHAVAELEGGENGDGLGLADAAVGFCQVADSKTTKFDEVVVVVVEDVLGEVDGALAWVAATDEYADEFGLGEGFLAVGDHLFAGLVGVVPIFEGEGVF